jgi:hypothetical protein
LILGPVEWVDYRLDASAIGTEEGLEFLWPLLGTDRDSEEAEGEEEV